MVDPSSYVRDDGSFLSNRKDLVKLMYGSAVCIEKADFSL